VRGADAVLLLLALAASLARYFPITANYFFGDDFLNLYHIVDDPLPRYLVTPNGGHVLLVRNAIFYLTWLVAGTDPRPYFWTVLVTHLLNVALLFGVVRLMTGSALLASFGAALWGTSVLSEGTLGWYAVYGHALVGTAVLVILYQALRAAESGVPPTRARRALWYGLALAAASCFGTGTAIALVLPLVLWILLPPAVRGHRVPLVSLVVAVPALYAAQVWAYQRLAAVDLQSVTILGKLLSAGGPIVEFGWHLLAFGLTRLLAGPFPAGPPAVWSAVLLGLIALLILTARSADTGQRRRVLAATVLVLATYGVIAAGRGGLAVALLHNAVDAVRLTPRYQYVGQLLLTPLVCVALASLAGRRSVPRPGILLAMLYGIMTIGHVMWYVPIDHHDDSRGGVREVMDVVDAAVAGGPPGGTVRIPNRAFLHLPLPPVQFPGWAAVFTIYYPDNVVDGRRVQFVERDLKLIETLRSGRRTGSLLVPP
jgi:hypothetical protein